MSSSLFKPDQPTLTPSRAAEATALTLVPNPFEARAPRRHWRARGRIQHAKRQLRCPFCGSGHAENANARLPAERHPSCFAFMYLIVQCASRSFWASWAGLSCQSSGMLRGSPASPLYWAAFAPLLASTSWPLCESCCPDSLSTISPLCMERQQPWEARARARPLNSRPSKLSRQANSPFQPRLRVIYAFPAQTLAGGRAL